MERTNQRPGTEGKRSTFNAQRSTLKERTRGNDGHFPTVNVERLTLSVERFPSVIVLLLVLSLSSFPAFQAFGATGITPPEGTGGSPLVGGNGITLSTNLGIITIDAVGGASTNGQPPSTSLSNLTANGFLTISNANSIYVMKNGNDTTAVRGRLDKPYLTPVAASKVAVPKDTVFCFPGQYDFATNLFKAGVNWQGLGYPWLTYTNQTNDAGIGIFDDRFSGAITSSVSGFNFRYSCGSNSVNGINPAYGPTNVLGPFIVTQALSFVNLDFNQIIYDDFIAESGDTAALCLFAGRGNVRGNEIIDESINTSRVIGYDSDAMEDIIALPQSTGAWWKRGEWHVTVNRNVTTKYGVYFHANTESDTGNFWYNGDYCFGKLYGSTVTTNQDWRSWIDLKELRVTNGSAISLISAVGGFGKFYLKIDKVGSPGLVLDLSGNQEVWLDCQKASGGTGWLDVNDGILHANVQHFEDLGTIDKGIWVRGGTLELMGKTCVVTNATGSAVAFDSGTLDISGLKITTLNSTNSPVVVSTNGAVFQNCKMVAKTGVFSVLAHTSAKTANLMGCWGNTLESNITYQVGPWTVDSNVR
jgi:hypothetical protein